MPDWVAPRSLAGAVDIVGIGAINHDYVATTGQVEALDRVEQDHFLRRFASDHERVADEPTIVEAIRRLEHRLPHPLSQRIGGSAFNALSYLGSLDLGLRLGFVGVAGRLEQASLDLGAHLHEHKIDASQVIVRDDARSGISLSFMWAGDRRLLTSVGANALLADQLTERFDDVVAYLGRARVVHVSSLIDVPSQRALAAVLKAVAERHPSVGISLDPGALWIDAWTEPVREMLALADYLLLNEPEFQTLGEGAVGEQDDDVARRIFARCGSSAVLVLKRSGGSSVFHRLPGGEFSETDVPHLMLAPESIEDATGAGDAFAAGFLATLVSWHHQADLGARLGSALARSRLQAGDADPTRLQAAREMFVEGEPKGHERDAREPVPVGTAQLVHERAADAAPIHDRVETWPRWAGAVSQLLSVVELAKRNEGDPVEVHVRWSANAVRCSSVAQARAVIDEHGGKQISRVEIRVQPSDGPMLALVGDVSEEPGLVVVVSGDEPTTVAGLATRVAERLTSAARPPRSPVSAPANALSPTGVVQELLSFLTPPLELLADGDTTRWGRFWPVAGLIVGLLLTLAGLVVGALAL
ncbi:MAG TPA: carbohydrate kinase family protein [Conexibacter sp.]|nr:carbohydrate kinase family protein [Conexibacter sp.]